MKILLIIFCVCLFILNSCCFEKDEPNNVHIIVNHYGGNNLNTQNVDMSIDNNGQLSKIDIYTLESLFENGDTLTIIGFIALPRKAGTHKIIIKNNYLKRTDTLSVECSIQKEQCSQQLVIDKAYLNGKLGVVKYIQNGAKAVQVEL